MKPIIYGYNEISKQTCNKDLVRLLYSQITGFDAVDRAKISTNICSPSGSPGLSNHLEAFSLGSDHVSSGLHVTYSVSSTVTMMHTQTLDAFYTDGISATDKRIWSWITFFNLSVSVHSYLVHNTVHNKKVHLCDRKIGKPIKHISTLIVISFVKITVYALGNFRQNASCSLILDLNYFLTDLC